MDEKIVWGYSNEQDAETWQGACDTREEAIEAGLDVYPDSDSIWVVQGRYPSADEVVPSAESILETMGERAYEDLGENVAEDWPHASTALIAELDAFLAAWGKKIPRCSCWTFAGEPEEVKRPIPFEEASDDEHDHG